MKVTIDQLTGKVFRWNSTVFYCGYIVPARETKCKSTHLHPSRVDPALLRKLNPRMKEQL